MLLSSNFSFRGIETFITSVGIIAVAIVVGKILSILIRRYIRRSAKVLNVDPTNYSFLQHAVSMMVFLGGVFFVFWRIPAFHDVGKTLFAGAGIFAAILGFASQEAFSNIISGIFIVIYKPFSVGDNISLLSNNQSGKVEDITLRHTIIKGRENRRIVIPNSVISREQILNSSLKDTRIKLYLDLLIAYESDHNKAMSIIKDEAAKHPFVIDGRTIKQKNETAELIPVKIVELNKDGVHLRAFIWAKDDDHAYEMKCDLLKILKERFEKEGIELAHDQKIFEVKRY